MLYVNKKTAQSRQESGRKILLEPRPRLLLNQSGSSNHVLLITKGDLEKNAL